MNEDLNQVREDLEGALSLIENPNNWCQGRYSSLRIPLEGAPYPAQAYCAVGAIREQTGYDESIHSREEQARYEAVLQHLAAQFPSRFLTPINNPTVWQDEAKIININDQFMEARTDAHKRIVQGFQDAIKGVITEIEHE